MSTGIKVVGAKPTADRNGRHAGEDAPLPRRARATTRELNEPETTDDAPIIRGSHAAAEQAVDGTPVTTDELEATEESVPPTSRRRSATTRRHRGAFILVSVVAVAGIIGTIAFGSAWAGLNSQQQGEAQAEQSARTFFNALTNFSAKTVDSDFGTITSMATGPFASQAQKFFNSSIRQQLMTRLAVSQGQIRSTYVETYGNGQASVYGVIDQLYSNSKLTTPQADVLRVVVNLQLVAGTWKISDVTVLDGPTQAGSSSSTGTSSTGTAATGTTPAG